MFLTHLLVLLNFFSHLWLYSDSCQWSVGTKKNKNKKSAHWPIESWWQYSFHQFLCQTTSSEWQSFSVITSWRPRNKENTGWLAYATWWTNITRSYKKQAGLCVPYVMPFTVPWFTQCETTKVTKEKDFEKHQEQGRETQPNTLPGFDGKVLAEVSHQLQRIKLWNRQDSGRCLETEICGD